MKILDKSNEERKEMEREIHKGASEEGIVAVGLIIKIYRRQMSCWRRVG